MDGPRAPQPRPLDSGFSVGTAYRVLGLHAPSETGEAYFVLSNDRDEVWFVSNRHFRTYALMPGVTALRLYAMHTGDGQMGDGQMCAVHRLHVNAAQSSSSGAASL